jgi:uncharacterized sulfatase
MTRTIVCLILATCFLPVARAENPAAELERATAAAQAARLAAAKDPTVTSADSPPVRAYLAEQTRRRLLRLATLHKKIEQYQADPATAELVPVLKEQLADLQKSPPDLVTFDGAYGYQPTTGLLGYSKKVRLLENLPDGQSIILVDNAALVLEGLGTSEYASGKFFGIDKAILVGGPGPEYTFQGSKRKRFAATLVDLEALLKAAAPEKKTAAALPAGRQAAGKQSGSNSAVGKRNVLLIVVDDLNTELGCYGNSAVITPNIDRLAARGVRFERAYCQYALCAPSRWSFLSGLRPETTGIFEFKTLLREKRPEVVFLPQLFREQGYFTAGMGKIFHDERQSDREKSWDFYSDKMGDDAEEAAAVKHRYSHPEGNRPFGPWTKLTGPEEKTRDGATSRRIAQHMTQCAQRGKPFFVAAGFHKPHLPWTAPTKYYDLYASRQIAEPKDPPIVDIPKIALETELVGNPPPPRAEAISTYYTCISFMDAQVGVLLDTLDREKLWDNTVVVFFSDHGFHLGDHEGLWAKFTVFDRGCRVPLVIAAPGQSAGAVSPRTVELIDIYPTLAELCGLSAPKDLEGQSLAPLLADPKAAWDKPARSLIFHDKAVGKTVVNERWRYTEWEGGKRGVELYDHTVDAGEYRNLAGDPQHARLMAELKRQLIP